MKFILLVTLKKLAKTIRIWICDNKSGSADHQTVGHLVHGQWLDCHEGSEDRQ